MQFFETLATLQQEHDKIQFQIGITIDKGITVVSVVPKTTGKSWTPFIMRGTPQQLDAEFETQLENLKAGLGHISNAATYAETIKKEVVDTAKAATKTQPVKSNTPPPKKTEAAKSTGKPAPKVEAKKPETKTQPEPETNDEEDAGGLFGDE